MGKNKKTLNTDVTNQEKAFVENCQENSTEEKTDEQEVSSDVEMQKEQIRTLEAEIEELKDKNLRMLAEFDNFRRRSNKEKLELMVSAGEDIFKEMLPLVDDFERAVNAANDIKKEDIKQLQSGVELIYAKFKKFLSDHSVSEIETQNVDFSTDMHEALTTVDAGKDKQGKIIECTRKGYKMGDKVIRYAQVIVGK